jgi:hypothetical protein
VIKLSLVSPDTDPSKEFTLSFSSHPGVSVVQLLEDNGDYFPILGRSNSEDVKVVHKDGYIITQIDGTTCYLKQNYDAIYFK